MPSDVVHAGAPPLRRLLLASLAICCAVSTVGICLFTIHTCHVIPASAPRRLVYGPAAIGVLQARRDQDDEIIVDTDRNGTWTSVATAPDDRTKSDDGSRSVVVTTACGEQNQDGDCPTVLPAAESYNGYYRSYGNRCGLKARQNYPPDPELRRGCESGERDERIGRKVDVDYDGDEGLVDEVNAVDDRECKQVLEIRGRYRYFLAAVIANRIFEDDRFGMGAYEAKQWIEYMLYAGVEHIYWYDTAHDDGESQRQSLAAYAAAGLLTYHRFHGELFHPAAESIPRGYHFEQDESYRHFLRNYANLSRWVVELDVDEYPFSPSDTHTCFLQRFLWGYERQNWAPQQHDLPVTQILMNCMFFLGNPTTTHVNNGSGAAAVEEEAWVVEKYRRRKTESEGSRRQKPIFRAEEVERVENSNPHGMVMRQGGRTAAADERRLRMNHYWGPRATDFRPDTPELAASLVPDASAADAIAAPLKAFTHLISARSAAKQLASTDSIEPL